MATQFLALADLLAPISEAGWDTTSLGAGWRAREIVAHMTMASWYPLTQFSAEIQGCDGDLNRLFNRIVTRDADLPPNALIASLRNGTIGIVLDDLTRGGTHAHFGFDLEGLS